MLALAIMDAPKPPAGPADELRRRAAALKARR
jgi:hypothetical protein